MSSARTNPVGILGLQAGEDVNEPMRLLTHDTNVARYSDTIVFV